jgi:hypothetical protein
MRDWLVCSTLIAACVLAFGQARASDGWEGRPSVCAQVVSPVVAQRCHEWVSTVKRPDTRTSCCGEGDAFVADNFRLEDGVLIAIITNDYPTVTNEQGNLIYAPTDFRYNLKAGTEIKVPQEKVNHALEDVGNVSGHGVIFLGGQGEVYCFIFPPLT